MKTIKLLKISIALQAIFAFSCISSTLCFAVNRYFEIDLFFSLGVILAYGWIINPFGLISVIVGLMFFFTEKDVADNRQIIKNKKGLWLFMS